MKKVDEIEDGRGQQRKERNRDVQYVMLIFNLPGTFKIQRLSFSSVVSYID